MKFILIFLIIISIILETTMFPIGMSSALIVALSIANFTNFAGLIFGLGLMRDMFGGAPWGTTSLTYLLIYLIVKRYQSKLHSGSPLFQVILMALASAAQSFIYSKTINIIHVVFSAFIGLIVLHIYYRLDPHRGGGRGKISLN